jgi:hypothetical protein
MSSGFCKRSFFLLCCAFIALLLMSGGATGSAHTRATFLSQGKVQQTTAAPDLHAAIGQAGWHHNSAGDGSGVIDDQNADDELVLPAAPPVWLDYSLSAAPLSAEASPYSVRATSLLRPPSLA